MGIPTGMSDTEDGETKTTRYGAGDYWDDRYGGWAPDPYDWLFEWHDVAHVVEALINKEDTVLVPGCGNAPFAPDMYDAGFTNQVCFDTSAVVVEQMRGWHEKARPAMQFHEMDATSLPMENGSFNAVMDK